jgi:hypothetical protein
LGSDILKAGKGIRIGSIDRYLNKQRVHFYEVDSTIAKVENKVKSSVWKSITTDEISWINWFHFRIDY